MQNWKFSSLILLDFVPPDVCVCAQRNDESASRHVRAAFLSNSYSFFVCVITHLRMAHWSFAHNNDMLVLPTHKCTLAYHMHIERHAIQHTQAVQARTAAYCTKIVQKHENGVFCCWIFIIKRRRRRRKYVCLVYREMKCVYKCHDTVQTTKRRGESAVYLIQTNMFILKIHKTHFESRNDEWNERRTESEGRGKKTLKESKLLYAYSHNHWHFSLMRPD